MAVLPPEGVGNSLWAFGVLCFWHEPFVQAWIVAWETLAVEGCEILHQLVTIGQYETL